MNTVPIKKITPLILFIFCFLNVSSQIYRYSRLIENYKIKDTISLNSEFNAVTKELPLLADSEKIVNYLAIGQIYSCRGDHGKASENFFNAFKIAKSTHHVYYQYLCYFKIGCFYQSIKAPPSVIIKYLYTAKKLFNGNKLDKTYYILLRLIGYIETETNNNDLAIKTYAELIDIIALKGENHPDNQSVYNNLGTIYTTIGNYDKAEKYLNKSLELIVNDSDAVARSFTNFGTLFTEKKEYETALNYYNQAYNVRKRNNHDINNVENVIYIGIVLKKMHKYAEAINKFESALKQAKKNNHLGFMSRLLPHMADCYYKVNSFQKAYECQKQFEEVTKASNENYEQETILKHNIEYSFEKQLFEDSIRNDQNILKLQFENEKKLSIKDEKQKRNILIYIFGFSIIIIIGFIIYVFQKQKANLKIKDSEIKALQSQMNPHFIFNSLNSVLEFISKSEKESSIKFLTKFSRLIRLVLEHSNKKTISLAEEIELLNIYIELEKIKTENGFDSVFDIDENLDIENYEIPAMLIQPFIENSIIHGIQNKIKLAELEKTIYKGELKISFLKNGEFLKCIVEDNGIGREKAQKIKNNKSFNHLSLGMRITKDRLDFISNYKCQIEYFDLKDTYNNSIGTKAEILIPLMESF
ncbi:MAG: tetratricopeptide repeat protein [Bacteroidota bacterium]|nr:tetratricopeptide repeat protein [Bacteroidota bacterium]